jgi:hypothetical protein
MSVTHQIFVSHSKRDKDIRKSFNEVIGVAGLKPICMEFETLGSPQWQDIRNAIATSETTFLLLGPKVRSSIHTQNWIAFEIGVSCAFGKDVWVFEQAGSKIKFPIPYLTDYLMYNLDNKSNFDYVREIIEGYGRPQVILPTDVDQRTKRKIPRGIFVDCASCHSKYFLHNIIKQFCCPSCRQELVWQEQDQKKNLIAKLKEVI